MMKYTYAASTKKGKGKIANEDRIMIAGNYLSEGRMNGIINDKICATLCDGISGNRHGEKAAEIAALHFLNMRDTKEEDIPLMISEINYKIYKTQIKNENYKRTSTTLAGISINNDTLLSFNMGDTRIYLIQNEDIRMLSKDHTLAQYLADEGIIPKDKVSQSGYNHILTQYLGGSICESGVTIMEEKIHQKNKVLVMSDGIYKYLDQKEIYDVANQEISITERCDQLIDIAEDNGSHDDMSVCMIEIS